MKKLKLQHEDLRVESFGTEEKMEGRGTVVGQSGYGCPGTYQGTCHNTGCNGGLTSLCGTAQHTDCPGQTKCSWTEPVTCFQTCTDYGCTGCGACC